MAKKDVNHLISREVSNFRVDRRAKRLSPKTTKFYSGELRIWTEYLGPVQKIQHIEGLELRHIRDYLVHLGETLKTRKGSCCLPHDQGFSARAYAIIITSMNKASFHFLPDLAHFFLPPARAGGFEVTFEPGQTVKHLVEAAGVPHTEIGRFEANGTPVTFDYQVQDGDQVLVYPATAASSPYPGPARFVLDNHLGRLAAYLRMLGFDSVYRNDFDDEELAQISADEDRILLTRDRRLLMRKAVRWGYCLRSLDSRRQVEEVLLRFALTGQIAPFKRCLRCNASLRPVEKAQVLERLEPLTKRYYEEFHICPACGQVYWKGSHYEHMQQMIDRLRGQPGLEGQHE